MSNDNVELLSIQFCWESPLPTASYSGRQVFWRRSCDGLLAARTAVAARTGIRACRDALETGRRTELPLRCAGQTVWSTNTYSTTTTTVPSTSSRWIRAAGIDILLRRKTHSPRFTNDPEQNTTLAYRTIVDDPYNLLHVVELNWFFPRYYSLFTVY